ncbi:MAG TPA: hypothetical protein VH442_05910, partial [Micromonosporaceae bacterium]
MDAGLARATELVGEFAGRPAYGLPDEALRVGLVGLHRLASLATAAAASLANEARGRELPRRDEAASTVTWLRDLLRIAPPEARQLMALGDLIESRPGIAAAIGAGALNSSQALAIGHALAAVPDDEPAL